MPSERHNMISHGFPDYLRTQGRYVKFILSDGMAP